MEILLDIKDNKADFFLELLKNFSFVKAKPISNKKKTKFLSELEESIEEVKLHKQGKIKMKSAEKLLNEKKYSQICLMFAI